MLHLEIVDFKQWQASKRRIPVTHTFLTKYRENLMHGWSVTAEQSSIT